MEIKDATNYRDSILAMLEAEKLPVSDLPSNLDDFFVALDNNEVIGTAGLETYGNCGLLRSLAVSPEFRGKGVAGRLISRIEATAFSKGLKCIYLLTETAQGYFKIKFYNEITRADVPAEVQASSEFSQVCPESAIVMKKILFV